MGWLFSKPSSNTDLMTTGWCEVNWDQNNEMKENFTRLQIKNPGVKHLHILVTGPVGAGKSRFIQSIGSILQNKMSNASCTVASFAGKSFTCKYTTTKFKDQDGRILPFVITDVMGLESGRDRGVQPEDIITALKGHIREDYEFHPTQQCSEGDVGFNPNPTLNDKIHCLVFVILAESFTAASNSPDTDHNTGVLIDSSLIQKMEQIRRKACDLRIPHVVVLTKADLACPCVKDDVRLIYRSKSIHRKAKACSNALGIPMSDIFPVKNYDEEKQLNPDVDAVLLFTLTQILDFANDFVEKMKEREAARVHTRSLTNLAVGEDRHNHVQRWH